MAGPIAEKSEERKATEVGPKDRPGGTKSRVHGTQSRKEGRTWGWVQNQWGPSEGWTDRIDR